MSWPTDQKDLLLSLARRVDYLEKQIRDGNRSNENHPAPSGRGGEAILYGVRAAPPFIRTRAASLVPFSITMSHQKLWHAFPKKSFTALFGGNSQHGPRVAVSPPRARETGYSGFLFLKHFYQPFIPVEPGEPGVFVSASLRQPDWPTHEKVLVSAIAGERNPTGGYRYVGDYELLLEGGPLTVDEVRLLHPRVLDYWTRYVRDASSKHTWVEEMRMRILCRKYFPGQEPSEAIIRKAGLEKLTLGDVSEAFKDGDEKLYAWGMRCVWYEPSFQERLIEGQIADDEQDGRESRGSTAEDGSSPIETRSGRERAARKRARTGESSEGIIEVDDDM